MVYAPYYNFTALPYFPTLNPGMENMASGSSSMGEDNSIHRNQMLMASSASHIPATNWEFEKHSESIIHRSDCPCCHEYYSHIMGAILVNRGDFQEAQKAKQVFQASRSLPASSSERERKLLDRVTALQDQLQKEREKTSALQEELTSLKLLQVQDLSEDRDRKRARKGKDRVIPSLPLPHAPVPKIVVAAVAKEPSKKGSASHVVQVDAADLLHTVEDVQRYIARAQQQGNEEACNKVTTFITYAHSLPASECTTAMLYAMKSWQPPKWKVKAKMPAFNEGWQVWRSFLRQNLSHEIQGIKHRAGDVDAEEIKAYLLCKQLSPVRSDGKSPVLERSQWMHCCVALLLNKGTYNRILQQQGLLIDHFVIAKRSYSCSTVNLTVEEVAVHFAQNGIHVNEVDNAHSYAQNWVESALAHG